jgi:arylsulfatase A-like enzyme
VNSPGSAAPSGRPNIVFILIDDLGWADVGCYGSTFYETPRLDRLAAEGALFTDAYAASPVCSPTRASLLTGKYPPTVGVTQYIGGHGVGRLLDVPYFGFLPTHELSLARALREGGYQTWHVGKWHLGPRRCWPDQHGFDVNLGGCEWGHPKSYFSPYHCPTLSDGPDGEYLTDRLTDEAIRLIGASGDRPFFLNLWHYAVHIPIDSPPALVAKYEQKARQLGLDAVEPFAVGEPFGVWHQRRARITRRTLQSDPAYAAMIENLDTNVGRLLDALDETGQAGNTLVVFTSDNGGLATAEGSPTCNAPLAEGKGWLHEGGVREPLIARWPGVIPAGTRISEPVTSPDFYPTLLSAAGLAQRPGQHVDGVDFSALLRGEPFSRGPLYFHYPHYSNQGGRPASAIRDGDWKLVHDWETGRSALFRLSTDMGETTDLAVGEPALVTRLQNQLRAWVADGGYAVPAPNAVPDAYPDLAGYFLHGQIATPPVDPDRAAGIEETG